MELSAELNSVILDAIKNKYFLDLRFIIDYFTYIVEDEYEDKFIKISKGKFYSKVGEELFLISSNYKQQVMHFNDTLVITKNELNNVPDKFNTMAGTVICNWLINTYCLNDKISYINDEFTLGDIEDIIITLYNPDIKDGVTTKEYKAFLDMSLYIDTFAMFLGVGVTEHSILPAPGIAEFVKKKIAELEKEFNETPLTKPSTIAVLEKAIIEYDVAYLKKDISYGKLISKKVIATSRKRMYGVYGIGNDVTGKKTPMLIALNDGIGSKPEVLTALFNDLRGGVASRGNETKDAGVTTKELQKAVAGVVVKDTDCGQTIGLEVTITESNANQYVGKTIIDKNNTLITLDNYKNYIGKTIELRDEFRCLLEDGVCLTCIGKQFTNYKKTISLMAIDLGGLLLAKKLSKFHGVTLAIANIEPSDIK